MTAKSEALRKACTCSVYLQGIGYEKRAQIVRCLNCKEAIDNYDRLCRVEKLGTELAELCEVCEQDFYPNEGDRQYFLEKLGTKARELQKELEVTHG